MLWQLILGQPQIGSGNVPTSDDSYWAAWASLGRTQAAQRRSGPDEQPGSTRGATVRGVVIAASTPWLAGGGNLAFALRLAREGPLRTTAGRGRWRTDTANQRGGEWMGAGKNSSRRRWKLQQDEHSFQHTSPTHYLSWPSPRSH
jgi:hypothetical protein